MDEAVHDYYSKVVREKYEPYAIATAEYPVLGIPAGTISLCPGTYLAGV